MRLDQLPLEDQERFASRIVFGKGAHTCWQWQGKMSFGACRADLHPQALALWTARGPWDPDTESGTVKSTCHDRCVNPAHLYWKKRRELNLRSSRRKNGRTRALT